MGEKKSSLLYIDDEEVNLFLFSRLFQNHYDIQTCVSADEALGVLDNNKDIKVVVVDMNMPSKNGLEFINESKKRHSEQKLVYIILTGYALNSDLKNALNNGNVSMYLSKPFDVNSIVKAIDSMI